MPQEQQDASPMTASMLIRASAQGSAEAQGYISSPIRAAGRERACSPSVWRARGRRQRGRFHLPQAVLRLIPPEPDHFNTLAALNSRHMRARSELSDALSVICRSMEIRYDLPDFRRRMLTAERRSGNQIFAHRQSADDDGVKTNLSDEARRDINTVRVVAGDRNPDEFALPVRVRRQLGIVDRVESAHDMRAR